MDLILIPFSAHDYVEGRVFSCSYVCDAQEQDKIEFNALETSSFHLADIKVWLVPWSQLKLNKITFSYQWL